MYIIKKGIEKPLSSHLNSREIDCKCDECEHTVIDDEAVKSFEKLREAVSCQLIKETPLTISSGNRCHTHNKTVEGAKLSMHMIFAMDILCPPAMDVETFAILAKQSGFNYVQRYFDVPRIHVDNRSRDGN